MKAGILILFFFLSGVSSAIAQVTVSGYVRTADSLPVPQASVLIHDISIPEKPLVSFTTADNKGFYSLRIEQPEVSYRLTVRAASYQTVEKNLNIPEGITGLRENFVLFSSVSYLDTVKVDIRVAISQTGDTITFNPDAFTLKNETNIEDMLKRLPGMEVKEDGKVYFNGKLVSNVLIDGDDLFKKDYQLLTKNAAPKIVDKVQVIKNYQKDLLLKEFNQAGSQVINLKIKDQYKNYLFGNMTAGYGTDENKLGDLFLIRLSPNTKAQAGVNYNTIGNTYNNANRFNAADFLQNENFFFTYRQANPLLSVARYYYQNIPDHYQQRNESMQAHANLLMKKNNWETLLNAKYTEDRLRQNQQSGNTYPDGTFLYTHDDGVLKDRVQDYKFTASKNAKNESVYLNASLQKKLSDYGLQTASNHSLESRQTLNRDNLNGQLNLNYNRKLGAGMLWSNTLGYYNQEMDEHLLTDPDFLFWLFPDDLSLNILRSHAHTRLRYLNLKTSLLINGRRMTHELSATYSHERRRINTRLESENIADGKTTASFPNEDALASPWLAIQYEGKYQLSKKYRLTFKLSNQPQLYHYQGLTQTLNRKDFFYDYSAGISARSRTVNSSLTAGVKKKPAGQETFYSDYLQSGFHRLQSGRLDPYGEKSTYLQANYSLFSVKLGWIAFMNLNVSRNENRYIRNIETKGIATVQSFVYHPNVTHQLVFLFNSQKTMGDWPFSLNSNVLYNLQSFYNSFNDQVNKSQLQFLNTTVGFKSLFESFVNFDYNFLWSYSRNTVRSSAPSSSGSYTLLNKLNLHLTPPKWFNTTFTFNNMISNRGAFNASFLDIKCNRKFMKERLVAELFVRNIFDKNYLSNTTITSYYTQENKVQIRGAEFFFTLRYEIR